MKNIVKLSAVALTVLSLAACDPSKKPAEGNGSTPTTVKVDSPAKTGIDTTNADTGKKDTIKK